MNSNSVCSEPSDSIVLTFGYLHTHSSADVVEVYDGNGTDNVLIGRFYGHETPSSVAAVTGSMVIIFRTDSRGQHLGFSASFHSGN
jgi:hypothetical protein